jgi:hypothetical protein
MVSWFIIIMIIIIIAVKSLTEFKVIGCNLKYSHLATFVLFDWPTIYHACCTCIFMINSENEFPVNSSNVSVPIANRLKGYKKSESNTLLF